VIETVRYTYRLRPGATAEDALVSEWHRCRWLWNEAVHQHKSGRVPTFCKQSRGYGPAERQNAKVQKKAARQNQHDGRMWARTVVASHDLIAVEDFRPTFLARSTMAYATMTCSECGERQARLGLAERTFRCPSCGYTADRDRNAARVILAVAERGHASADDVSHRQPPPGGSLVRSELEIPRL
jgi:predicted RNA-binding Zn-ribbon protein involved in translation (DUF1610 family)